MTIHKEGYPSIVITVVIVAIINAITHYSFHDYAIVLWLGYSLSAFLLIIILQFFRSPSRTVIINDNNIIAPADGKVVVIEEVREHEYFKSEKRLQISIFMSPLNVHVNRFPISGIIKYVKYHPGLFLVAWHPKSSTDNERTTIVVKHDNGKEVMFRQIAGAVARRIVNNAAHGNDAVQGEEFGFIKFGSRVDLLLPTSVKVKVKLEEKVKGSQTVIATFE